MSAIARRLIGAEAKNSPTSGKLFFLDLGAGVATAARGKGQAH